MIASLANFGTNAVVARFISKSAYGAVGSVLALATLIAIPISAMPASVTRQVATGSPGEYELGTPLLWSFGATVATVSAAVLVVPLLNPLLHLSGYWPILLLGIYLGALILEIVPRGSLVGERHFVGVAVIISIAAIARVGIAGSWVVLHPGPVGPLAAAALAEIVSFTALCAFMIFSLTPGPRNRSIHLSEVGLAAIGYAGVLSLMSIDTIAARHWLGGAGSGYYAAASGAGSIAYFLAANAGTAFLPDVAKGAHEQNRRSFLIGLVEVSLLACGSAVLLILGGPIVLRILFGSGYQAARFPLYWLSASYAALGITAYLVTHHLAHRSTAILLTWIGPVILLVALFLAHRTVVEIAVDALVSSGSLLFIMATSSASLERGVSRQRRARATSEVLDAT